MATLINLTLLALFLYLLWRFEGVFVAWLFILGMAYVIIYVITGLLGIPGPPPMDGP